VSYAEHRIQSVNAPLKIGARRASLDIAVQVVGRIGNLALGVVVTLMLIRSLGARGFGAWSTIFAVSQIATNFGELGVGQIAISRAAADPKRESDWLSALLSLRLLLAVPIMLTSAVAVLIIAPTSESELAGVLISCALLLGAPSAMSAVFQLRVRNDISTALLTLNSVAWAIAVIAVAALSGGIVAFAAAFLAVATITSIATVLTARRIIPIRLSHTRKLWSPLLRVGFGVGIAGILVTSYVKLDQILVLELAGARQAGLYGAAYRVLDQVQFIPDSVMTTLYPLIASCYPSNLPRLRGLLQLAAEYLAIASLPILAFTIVAARPIASFLFGAKFIGAAPALPILMAAFVSISFGYLAGSMVVILELQNRFVRYAALGLALNAVLNVLLIPRYGFIAAAWITLLTEVVVMSSIMRRVLATLVMKPSVNRFLRTLGAAIVMGLITWSARELGIPLVGLVIIGGISYLLAVMVLRVLTIAEVKAMLRKEPLIADNTAATISSR
jgi:O-antigen/teichoic acid export membrane protein